MARQKLAIPEGDIRWLMARVHVSQSDEEVKALIADRVGDITPGSKAAIAGWTPARLAQAQRYALRCHRSNQELYGYVMGGSR